MSLSNQKHLFDIPEDVTYLNTAALSPAFKAIEEAGIQSVLKKNRPYLITGSDFFDPVIELRALFGQLIDIDHVDRIVTIPSVSYGLANVANNVTLKKGDEILIIDEQFPSNYYIWKKLTDQYDATLKVVKAPDSQHHRGKLWNESILDSISENTALVAMGQVHWSNGILFDLKAIREKTRQHEALLIIDGSQSIGAFPFSIKEIQPDALIVAGYKWLFGPYGGAFGYYGAYFDHGNPMEENWINRIHSEDFAGLTEYQLEYKPMAQRYAVGESGSFIYVQMRIAALKQLLQWKPEEIQEYCKQLTKNYIAQLKDLGCSVEDDDARSHHMFGIELPEHLDIEILKQKFAEKQIYVSFRGHYLRISCHLFNTEKDFQVLVNCIESCLNRTMSTE
jgi:selenocysteine lyase/cysteine desulfurase